VAVIKLNPTAKKVKQDQERFLRLIGESITVWSFIDRTTFWTCEAALRTDRKTAAIVYYSWIAFKQRVELTDELVKSSFTGRKSTPAQLKRDALLLKEWKAIRNSIRKLSPIRNAIAHNPPARTGIARKDRAVYLFKLAVEPAEIMRGKKSEFDIRPADMRNHFITVQALGRRMTRFLARFRARLQAGA
jgi:hypothetical protein